MNVVPAIRLTLGVLRREPDAVLPYYLAAAAVPLVGQTVALAGLVVAYVLLAAEGRIAEFVDAMAGIDLAGFDPVEPDPEAVQALADALALLVTPGTLAVAALSMLGAIVFAVVAGAVVSAGQLHAVRAVVDRPPARTGPDASPARTGSNGGPASPTRTALRAGVTGAGRDVWRFVRLALLSLVLYVAPLVLVGALVGLAAAVSPVLAILAILAAILLVLPALLAVFVVLLFVPQAIVVDDVGVLRAVRHNLRFVRSNPWTAAGFVVLRVGLALAVGTVTGVLSLLSMPSLVPLVGLLLVSPVVGLVGIAIYLDQGAERAAGHAEDVPAGETAEASPDEVADAPPDETADPRPGTWDRLRAGGRRAGRTLAGFVRAEAALVAVALAVFVVGSAAGWRATSALPFPAQTAPSPGEVFGLVPVDDSLNLAANNWRVAVAQAFAGVAAGIPTLVNLLFNGFVVGALAGAGYDPAVFLALVLPHGIVEVPALAVASALGLSLGRDGWRYARGRADADALAAGVERAFYVLVGLVPVFLLAGLVEAFVTPWIGAFVAG